MTRSALRDLIRSEWPTDAIECRDCLGSGGSFDQHERCDGCMGRGYVLPERDLPTILHRTLSQQLAFSDRAAGS